MIGSGRLLACSACCLSCLRSLATLPLPPCLGQPARRVWLAQVINGASDLMVAVFGEAGRHARSAVGVNVLPLGVTTEVEAIVELFP
jgi:hypothetical protein